MISFTITSENPHSQLWNLLEKEKKFSKEQFKDALKQARKEDRHITEVLFEKNHMPSEKLLFAFSEYFNVPPVILKNRFISPYILNLIPKEVAEEHSVIIFKKIKNIINVATVNPENTQTIEFIKKKTGLEPKIFITTPDDIGHALKKYKSEITTEFAKIINDTINETLALHDTAEKMAQYVPIIKIVDTIIERGLIQGASDIHFEPKTDNIIIRFRIDGMLHRIVELPIEILPPMVTRLKIMANLKIDEHRLPQDGRFRFIFNDRGVDIRVSAVPTLHGTKIVLRLLDPKEKNFSLQKLGFNQKDFLSVKQEMNKPHGMILVTGPTGSGKTTTLYTLLRMLNKEDVNICTIEDPIEYGVDGINQTQINPVAGLTFANGLRSLLRQDPNIIMVGEIRDTETADMSVNAAMTGHLVLSTLHTNNAFLAIQRLTEMGVQPFLAASVINLIIAQRLVRKICPHCKSKSHITEKVIAEYKSFFNLEDVFLKLKKLNLIHGYQSLFNLKFSHAKGCAKCNGTGYRGRIGIYEILKINDDLNKVILQNPYQEPIKKEALRQGVLTILEDGVLKVLNGQTTFEEVMRVTKE